MKIEGQSPLKSLKGTAAEKKPTQFPIKTEGKSFGTTFDKAVAHSAANPPVTANPIEASSAATADLKTITALPVDFNASAGPEGPIKKNAISADDAMETIKFRLKSGYYNSKPVTDALTDKLTGLFDELA